MSEIASVILNKDRLINKLPLSISKKYSLNAEPAIKNKLQSYMDTLREGLYFFVEYPYVDKVYRNSYYFYYSSKHREFPRDCLRISLFAVKITETDFRDESGIKKLKDNYLGFIVIRPTLPNIIGRTMISPRAIKDHNFISCLTVNETLVNGVKLRVPGFPHSSQDSESISCAETTIWSVLEYFGSKYNEYKTVLPDDIIAKLNSISFERQTPTHGLTIGQISYSLKQFGFSPRIYMKNVYVDDFKNILLYYIESGIPVIATLQNNSIGHAIVLCGHENINFSDIQTGEPVILSRPDDKNIRIYDTALFKKRLIAIDDNLPPYRFIDYDNPASNYSDESFKNCEITGFVVPLYAKIFIEATIARQIAYTLLKEEQIGINATEITFRLFLTSSRSFKTKITANALLQIDIKEIIINKSMPKFIWVAEISDMENYKNKKATGMIIIDATSGEHDSIYNSVIQAFYKEKYIIFDNNMFNVYNNELNPFCIFENNLRGV